MPSNFYNLINGLPINLSGIGGISDLELIDYNLYYLIKEVILPLNGYTANITETLSPGVQEVNQDTGLLVTPYQSSFPDWCYYNPDITNPALTGLITTPILSVSGNLEHIDYLNGTIYYSGTRNNTVDVTYSFYNVWVQDGYPEQYEEQYLTKTLRSPAVSIDFTKRKDYAQQVGGGYEQERIFNINILATSDPQRDDLMDILENSLRYPYFNTIDYRNGFPMDFNGDKGPLFNRNSRWKEIYFQSSSSDIIRIPKAPDKLRHQGEISLNVCTND